MNEQERRARNLWVWLIVGFLLGGPVGAVVAFLLYIAFD